MAKSATPSSDRSDPAKNKSLAIRNVIKKLPRTAKASEIAAGVKKEYGHEVSQNQIYMIKTKLNLKRGRRGAARRGRPPRANGSASANPTTSWVEAIKSARQLLKAAGSVENATALLKAVEG